MLPALIALQEEAALHEEEQEQQRIIENEEERREEDRQQYRQLQLLMRAIRDSTDPFAFPNAKFISEFRLSKYLVRYLLEELMNVLPPRKAGSIPPEIKIFATLGFLATGTYQRIAGSLFYLAMSQSSMSKILHEIVDAIYNNLVDKWIIFPSTDGEKLVLSQSFERVMGVPNVFGAVDGTLINILAPNEQEHNYVDRKGKHSKNIMIVCDYSTKILAVNAKYGGSSNDSFIWSQSNVFAEMREQYANGSPYMLLGDSGYPLQPWLLTPIPRAEEDTPEYRYTQHHTRARSCVERCIGYLKNRFRIISSDNVPRYDPSFVGRIVTVIACLHNMCILDGVHLNVENEIDNDDNVPNENFDILNNDNGEDQNYYEQGLNRRNNIIETFF